MLKKSFEYLGPLHQVLLYAVGPLVTICMTGPLAMYNRSIAGVANIGAVLPDLCSVFYTHPLMGASVVKFAELLDDAGRAVMEAPFTTANGHKIASNGVLLTQAQESGTLWKYLPRTISIADDVQLPRLVLKPVLTEDEELVFEEELGLV